jgi:FlaA1/EpsC-like NDP-sugar epimerase/predicted protein tyrosine phosphatase
MTILHRHRRPLVILVHLAAVAFSYYAAIWLRFDNGELEARQAEVLVRAFVWLLAIRVVSFVPFRLYAGLWRFAGLWDLHNIIGAVLSSALLFFVFVRLNPRFAGFPRSVLIIDAVLLILILGGLRFIRRIHREFSRLEGGKRVLIYGAGAAGEMIVRDMRHNSYYEYEPVGFIDDDRAKVGQSIHGVRVLGTRETLQRILAETKPDAVLVGISRAEPATIRSIVRALEPFKVPIQTLPNLRDILDGKVAVSQIRTLAVEDLLERATVGLDPQPIRHLIEGKRVLVTGAGGSIGSELCRQIVALRPQSLVALDRYENTLYAVTNELGSRSGSCAVHAAVCDVTNASRVRAILSEYRPEVVFHAAAHKHVPLMELNPCEAVLNNVLGTRVLIDTVQEVGSECFVLISTDKAVNPTSVMGATKRIAEMLVQAANGSGACVFTAVRFGNVLSSNGSVVPRFIEQIKAGGPVTVTHPEMRRYFILIPEAVGLALHAAALAQGRDMFVLEMGKQVKVVDLARNLIRLCGFVPDEEIPITLIGCRPGEKLYEELVATDEEIEASGVKGISRIRPARVPRHSLLTLQIEQLGRLAASSDLKGVVEQLREIVPTYSPNQGVDGLLPVPAAAAHEPDLFQNIRVVGVPAGVPDDADQTLDPQPRAPELYGTIGRDQAPLSARRGVLRRPRIRRRRMQIAMNVLFVCSENLVRSPVAEAIFRELVGADRRHMARSAGTASYASRRVTTRELAWADVVAVMEPAHLTAIGEHWPDHAGRALVLGVPDDYSRSELELRAVLTPKIRQLIEALDAAVTSRDVRRIPGGHRIPPAQHADASHASKTVIDSSEC